MCQLVIINLNTCSTISSSSLDSSGGGNGGTPGGSLLGANVGTDEELVYALVFFKMLGGIGMFIRGWCCDI